MTGPRTPVFSPELVENKTDSVLYV